MSARAENTRARAENTRARPKVLYVAPVEPWGRENGSSLITADLLDGLARVQDADVLAVFLREPPPGYESRPADGLDWMTLGLHGQPKWKSLLKAIARGSAPVQTRFDDAHVAATVADAVGARGFRPDVVHVEHLPLLGIGEALAARWDAPLVYRAHNVESLLWERRLRLPRSLARIPGRSMMRAEARAIERADLTLCISDTDLDWTRRRAPRARAALLPCSLLIERYEVVEPAYRTSHPQMAFVGGLEWVPNEVGLRWFVHEVLPAVVAAVPDAKLTVLARGARDRPWLAENPAVRVLPGESSAASLFASSDVSVAPLLQGGGVRIKIPESLALGCPVVATPIGAEGSSLPGVTRTEEPRAFAEACIRHLRSRAGSEDRAALRAAVQAEHGATVVARRLNVMWTSLAGGSSLPDGKSRPAAPATIGGTR